MEGVAGAAWFLRLTHEKAVAFQWHGEIDRVWVAWGVRGSRAMREHGSAPEGQHCFTTATSD